MVGTPEIYRDKSGRFAPGSNPNPKGRPKREIEAEYLDATIAAVSIEDWARIVQAMVTFAKAGNVQAATWIGNYLLGKPQEHIAITAEQPTKYVVEMPTILGDDDGEALTIDSGKTE